MSRPNTVLDVWIVESNVVYKGVPFAVVSDWVQQGRLLDDDRVKTPTAAEWTRLAEWPGLGAYVPRPEPFRADDRAEALEPVALDVSWKKRPPDEEDDVDMIPLIDVSLVLLIFFMMTATVGGAAGLIPTPKARHGEVVSTSWWIGVDARRGPDGEHVRDAAGAYVPVYSLGQGDKLAEADAWQLASRDELLKVFDQKIAPGDAVEVRIKGNPVLPFELMRDLTVVLEPRKQRGQITRYVAEVSERDQ